MKNKDSSSLVGFVLIAIVLIFFNVFIFPKFQPEEKETASQSVQDFSQNDNLDNQEDLVKKLTELKELHEKKILSDEEFAAAKKKILGE